MKKINLILLDNNKLFLEGEKLLLEQYSCFNIVFSGTNSLSFFKELMYLPTPDLLITDISLTNTSVFTLITKVKKHFPSIKVLIVSSYDISLPYYLVDGYILKSVNSTYLLESIKRIVLQDKKIVHYKKPKSVFKPFDLTKREKQIVHLISNGLTLYEVASTLFISKHTVETHKKNIYKKLHVNTAGELVKKCIYFGLIK